MRGYDLILLAAILATLIITIVCLIAQKYWRIFDVFFGKKHGYWLYIALVAFGWAEVAVTTVLTLRSDWKYRPLWFLGLPLIAYAVWLFIKSVAESGAGDLVNAHYFGRPKPRPGNLQKKYKYPAYISVVDLYFGLSLTTGRLGYLAAAFTLLAGFGIKTVIDHPRKVAKR